MHRCVCIYVWCIYVCALGLSVKCFLMWITVKKIWKLLLSVIQQRTLGVTWTFSFWLDVIPSHTFHCCLHSGLMVSVRFTAVICYLVSVSSSAFVTFSFTHLLEPSFWHAWPGPAHLTSSISFSCFSYSSYISHMERIPVLWILFRASVPKLTLLSATNACAFFLSLVAVHLILTLSVRLSSRPLLLINIP